MDSPTQSDHRVISSLFNVVNETQRQMDPPVNTVRAQSDLFTVQCCQWDSKVDGLPNTVRPQSDLFTVQCCQWDSKADGPSSQHCQSTEWSLHCSMLSMRLKGRYLCYFKGKCLENHYSSLFNVVSETQRQIDSPGQHCQSTEWSLHCSMLSIRLKGRWTPQAFKHRCITDRHIKSV